MGRTGQFAGKVRVRTTRAGCLPERNCTRSATLKPSEIR